MKIRKCELRERKGTLKRRKEFNNLDIENTILELRETIFSDRIK